MSDDEEMIKKYVKRFKKRFPGAEGVEKELIPMKPGEELIPRTAKKKKRID